MAIPAVAGAASSAGASSSMGAAALSAGIQAGSGIIGSMVQAPFAKRRQKRNFQQAKQLAEFEGDLNLKNSKEIANFNQAIYERNRDHDEHRQDWLNENAKVIANNALRKAGFNPAWSQEGAGSLTYQPSSVAGSATSPTFSAHPFDYGSDPFGDALQGLFGGFSSYFDKIYEYRMKQAQIGLMESESNNLDSDTEGKDLQNDFFRNVKDLKEQMTNGEYNQMLQLQQYYKDNPELLKAVADSQAVLNEKINIESAKMLAEMDEIASAVGRNKSETRLANEKALTEQLNRCLTQAQINLLKDQNFRENYSNPSYLVYQSYRIEHSNLSDSEKDEQLAFIRQCLDECSNYSVQQRQHVHETSLQSRQLKQSAQFHSDEMEIQAAGLVVRSFDTIEGTIRHWSRKTNKGKKNDYGKKRGRESKGFRKYIDIFENN